jgi:hypothetical protein
MNITPQQYPWLTGITGQGPGRRHYQGDSAVCCPEDNVLLDRLLQHQLPRIPHDEALRAGKHDSTEHVATTIS